MSHWVDVATVEEIPSDCWRAVEVGDQAIIVVNHDGQYYAMADMCTHDGGPLSDGELEGCEMVCPRHGARFDIRDGTVTAPPAYEDLTTYSVRIENNRIQIQIVDEG